MESEFRVRATAAGAGYGRLVDPSAAFTDVSGAAAGSSEAALDVSHAAAGAPTPGAASFTASIKALAPRLSSAVTVPFYFITLLHLANEHGLALRSTPQTGLNDFEVAVLAEAAAHGGKDAKHA